MEKLLELCKRCDRVKKECLACEEYRKIVSGAAVKAGDHRLLLEFYKSADTTEENVLQAIMNNDLESVRILLEGTLSPRVLSRVLIHAIMEGTPQIIEALIEKGAKSKSAISAAISSGNPHVLETLVKRGGYRLNKKRLSQAIALRAVNMVESLLNMGVTPSPSDFASAIKDDQWHIVKLMYERVPAGKLEPEFEAAIAKHFNVKRAQFPNGRGGAGENMILTSFEEQLSAAYRDLRGYPREEIIATATRMNIDCDGKDMEYICKQVAYKLVYTHNTRIPEADNGGKCMRYTKKIASAKLNEIRRKIYKQFSRFKNSVPKMKPTDLHALLKAYDDTCFNGDILRLMREMKYTIEFKTRGEPTFTTEGICTHTTCEYTITILTEKFSRVNGITNVAGHMCNDQLECLMRVLEHELCHLIIFVFCTDIYIADQHGPLFINTISELFGHRDVRHYIW